MNINKIRFFIVFVYRCVNDKVEVLLVSKDGIKYEPFYFENKNHDQVKNALLHITHLLKDDFYKQRFVDTCVMLTVGKKDTEFKIEASCARIKETVQALTADGYKSVIWIKKNELPNYLNHWKGYTHSFKLVFPENHTSWECLETE